jgi:hypothetical protein
MDDNFFSFPQKGDQLFKEIVGDWHNACLYPLKDDMWVNYIIGYKDAADILVEYIKTTGKSLDRDLLAFPIVFLYRQYVELQLKMLIRDSYRLLGKSEDDILKIIINCKHRIDLLWKHFRTLSEKEWPEVDKSTLSAIEDFINQFCKIDPISIEFRYPIRKNGTDTLDNLDIFNINHLSDIVKSIGKFLGGIHDGISVQIEIIRDHDESPNE